MWKIFQEEFRKIASRKIVWIGLFVLLAFVRFRIGEIQNDYSVLIDGETFYGKEAIEKDKELTARYAGSLTEEKIREFYEKLQIPKLKGEGLLKPIPSRIRKVMERMQNIKYIDEDTFEIVQAEKGNFLPFDTGFYSEEIEKGYKAGIAKSRIEGYYEKYHTILKI